MNDQQALRSTSDTLQDRHDIAQLGAAQIASRIALGELTACQVVEACIAKIESVDARINAIAFPTFDRARRAAVEADEQQSRGGPLGPLHGVPVTIKECFHVAGTPSSMGLEHLAEKNLDTDGVLIERLRQAGAILLGKTNVPQLMLCHECENPLYGLTKNPWDPSRGPGGSSGGDAAIIAAGGVPLSLGSDLGGSIRVPVHFCGITGLLPTARRLPRSGSSSLFGGLETMVFQPGPMARRVEDLTLAMRVLCNKTDTATSADDIPCPFAEPADVNIEGMRIASWTDDGYFSPSPAIRRVVGEAAEALRERGAIVEDFQPPAIDDALRLYYGILAADGGADLRRQTKGSRADWRIARLLRIASIPNWLRPLVVGILRTLGQHRSADLLSSARRCSVDRFWQLSQRTVLYRQRFFQALDGGGYEAMLFPPHALPALLHRQAIDLIPAASYCYLPNLLGIPAGVVPIGRVGAGEESDRPHSRDRIEKLARKAETGSTGLPLGVQVAAKPWREDVVLAVMSALESTFCLRDDYPHGPPLAKTDSA